MRIFRGLFAMAIIILGAGCVGAYWLVNDRAAKKLDIVLSESQGIKGDSARGQYVAVMGGCVACHTNSAEGGASLAGGVPVQTPFGTFYSPNITSDKNAGIGNWTMNDFLKSMTIGMSPKGQHYFPVFPYTFYSVMTTQDMVDLKVWLDTVEPTATPVPDHDIQWPFSSRGLLVLWKALYFDPGRSVVGTNRGDYLVNGPGHCGACHAPRLITGGYSKRSLLGNENGPDGEPVPGITAHDLALWFIEDLELFLEVGITPSGDFTGGHMADVIEYSTGQLTGEDRYSIAQYLLSKANNR